MKNVVLVRHGETEGNVRRIIQGQSQGFELTERGKKQILRISAFLKDELAEIKKQFAELQKKLSKL